MDKFLIRNKKPEVVPVVKESEFPIQELSADDNDNEEDACTSTKKRKYQQKFRQIWLDKFFWLENKNGSSFCKLCNKTLTNNVTLLERHHYNKEKFHNIMKNQVYIDNMMQDENHSLQNSVNLALLTTVMFMAEHNLPFVLIDSLSKLFKTIFPDSRIAKNFCCGHTRAHTIMTIIGEEGIKKVCQDLRKNCFSLILDEATDISEKKSLVLVARQVNQTTFQARDKFLGLIESDNSTSEGLFQAIINYLKKLEVPLGNLIGIATDNANVMAGNFKSLKTEMNKVCDNLFFMGCVCHSIHLCASKACCTLPENIEKLSRDVYNFFAHSSKRLKEFSEFQSFCNIKPHKLLRPCQTRWLSLLQVVERLLEQWQALQLFFISNHSENGLKESTRLIAEELGSGNNKLYFQFLAYILKIINNMNLEFQSEGIRIYKVRKVIAMNLESILKNFIKLDYLQNLNSFKDIDFENKEIYLCLDDVYAGYIVESEIEKMQNDDIREFKLNIVKFYVTLSKEIIKRFNFEDEKLKILEYLCPKIANSSEHLSVMKLIRSYTNIIEIEKLDIEEISSEWRLLKSINHISTDLPVEQYWEEISKIKNPLEQSMFQNLSKFVAALFCLPHSSAAAERKFSRLNILKNKKTNRLKIETINHIMGAKELLCGTNSWNWKPNSNLLKRMN